MQSKFNNLLIRIIQCITVCYFKTFVGNANIGKFGFVWTKLQVDSSLFAAIVQIDSMKFT